MNDIANEISCEQPLRVQKTLNAKNYNDVHIILTNLVWR